MERGVAIIDGGASENGRVAIEEGLEGVHITELSCSEELLLVAAPATETLSHYRNCTAVKEVVAKEKWVFHFT